VFCKTLNCVLHTKHIMNEVVFVTFVLLWFTEKSSFEQYHSVKHITYLRSLILEL
jgi:hypothetical protein